MTPARPEAYRRVRLVRTADGIDGTAQAIFCDNDYLGLAHDGRVIEALTAAAHTYGAGSTASALITGYTDIHAQLEERLAAFTGRARALVFPSGYACNAGTLGALLARHDTIVADRANHASLIDGAHATRARCVRYSHADVAHARELAVGENATAIVTDGVFSMDGDCAPIAELAKVARDTDALLICDDAHGLGVIGVTGRGLCEDTGLSAREVPILTGTLGKAFGAQGGFVAGDADYVEEILQRARTYCYSTALAPALAAAADAALRIAMEEPEHREKLTANIRTFRDAAEAANIPLTASRTAIQPIIIGTAEDALAVAEALRQAGFAVRAIRPPTVPEGTSRLRITLSARHSTDAIEQLTQALGAALAIP